MSIHHIVADLHDAQMHDLLPSIPNHSDRILPSPFCEAFWSGDQVEIPVLENTYQISIKPGPLLITDQNVQESDIIKNMTNVWSDSCGHRQLLVHSPHSTSEQVRSVHYEPKPVPTDQLAVLFDVVQEQSDWESTRLYQASSVHSTHSESDTFTFVPSAARLPTGKYFAPAIAQSIPEVRDSHCAMRTTSPTSIRSQSYQSVTGNHRSSRLDSTVRTPHSSLRADPLHTFNPYPNHIGADMLHWSNGLYDEYEAERQQTQSVEPKPHRIRASPNSKTNSNVLLGCAGSSSGPIQHNVRSPVWRGSLVAQLVPRGSGQKPPIDTDRSRWTTESRWSPIDSLHFGCPATCAYRRGVRALRSNTLREDIAGPLKEHRPGESGRISRPFGYKSKERRGQVDRGKYCGRYGTIGKSARTENTSIDNQDIYYCFTCLTDRVYRKNICTHCKRAGLIGKFPQRQQIEEPEDVKLMTEHAQLLRSAARGLSELSQHSSDEDDDELSYQNSLPSTLEAQYSPYDSQPDRTSSDSQQSASSHHTYTMDSAGDVVKRLTDLSKQDHSNGQLDSACSLSNSGSFVSEIEKANGAGTYHRPKLPTTLMRKPSPRLGRIVPVSSALTSQSPVIGGKTDGNFLTETQKLVAQLEQRMITNGSSLLNGDAKDGNMELDMTNEDHEVAEAFLNTSSRHNPGINRRLLAMLRLRNPPLQSPESCRLSGTDKAPTEDTPRRQSNPPRRSGTAVFSSRPRSQQPTSRMALYNIDPDCRERGSSTTRTGSTTRVSRYICPENNGHPESYRSTLHHRTTPLRDGWETNRQSHLFSKSATVASPRLHSNPQETTKISALMNWQRRKAYDPRTAIAQHGARASSRASAQSLRDDDPASCSTDDGKQSHRPQQSEQPRNQKSPSNTKGFYRNKNINRRTAPVETSDCIDALASMHASTGNKGFPAHCSVVSNLLTPSRSSRTGNGYVDPTVRLFIDNGRLGTEPVERKKRSPRASSLNSSANDPDNRRETRTSTKTHKVNGRKVNQPGVVHQASQSIGRHGPFRCMSQTGHQGDHMARPSREMGVSTIDSEMRPEIQPVLNDMNYPDIGVESIRYKIEKLTNFIVRMRKRIERDYAEQGTCSPGDDMFGDEAVGATVSGRPTGMHPVVASSLKNLRILEVNAQEIFSLLYPTEVDLWEPARACLTGDIGDEKQFHEARSQLTEHIVCALQKIDEGLPFSTTPTQRETPEDKTPKAAIDLNPKTAPSDAVDLAESITDRV
ncbi:hypothetical protein FGIG_04832 [Fasciola gigantica]|uniref:Uncharacterized protein n=1 Tax=Fasciola gigantica TaxID=46835 RepID=A0A504YE94_FASGI|nr:hypothetical protein FGIG_04832 [Fasciola gigantica]